MNRALSKKLLYQLSKPFPINLLRQLSNQNFIFPFYHLVSDTPSPLVKHLYPVSSVSQFLNDLDYLQNNFTPAAFSEVIELAENKSYAGSPKFFLTFDDGFAECYNVILPILKERRLPAAFFVNPAFIGNRRLSHRQKVSLILEHVIKNETLNEAEELLGRKFPDRHELIRVIKKLTLSDSAILDEMALKFGIDFNQSLQEFKPYMDVSQLRKIKDAGFIIGSHGYDHPEFNLLSIEEMKAQIIRSFQFLSEELGIKERVFSFPFHDMGVPLSFFYFLKNDAGVNTSFGTSGIKTDNAPGHIHRIPMELYGFNGAESIIRSEYFYYLGKALVHRNRIQRQ